MNVLEYILLKITQKNKSNLILEPLKINLNIEEIYLTI